MNYAKHVANVPQSEPLPNQVANSAGGFSFAVDDWKRLERFLILGAEGGAYYITERKLTVENAEAVKRCIIADGSRVVHTALAISESGRAPKNDPALFVLAMAAKFGSNDTKALARSMLPKIARTGTHLFHFAEMTKTLGGWGRGTRRAFADWYNRMPAQKLAYQVSKYQQRDGWAHRDILRKAHPKAPDNSHQEIYNWAVKGWPGVGELPHINGDLIPIWAFERAKTAPLKELVNLICEYKLPHECVPNEMKDKPEVWDAMLPAMGATAMIRNLAKMTSVGLVKPGSRATKYICGLLEEEGFLKKGRVHPLHVLGALNTYAQGHGHRGKLSWTPVQDVVDALDGAFYKAFQAIEPTGKRFLLGVDISGSMDGGEVAGMPGISPRIGAAAMSLVTKSVEKDCQIMAFATQPVWLNISPKRRLDDVVKAMQSLSMGGTDCALPILAAIQNKLEVDAFVVYTDSETWYGQVHPVQALQAYRQATGIPAKLIVVGMTSNGFTIADPNDAGSLDIVGFDSAAPAVISDFVA